MDFWPALFASNIFVIILTAVVTFAMNIISQIIMFKRNVTHEIKRITQSKNLDEKRETLINAITLADAIKRTRHIDKGYDTKKMNEVFLSRYAGSLESKLYLYAPEINEIFSDLYDDVHEAQHVMDNEEYFQKNGHIADAADAIRSTVKPLAQKALEDLVR